MNRIPITKTPKCLVGGAFVRSESGRVYPLQDFSGEFFANIPLCTRKDLRNAVEAAAKAFPVWSARSAYNRGQILYRLAEMIEPRAEELVRAIMTTQPDRAAAEREVQTAIDRIVHYAGWTDKYGPLLGSVNPVASSHFNFTVIEPMGIVAAIAPDQSPLLGLLSMILPAITSGNVVVALASQMHPYPSILLGEMLAVSDLPAGLVNILTGARSDILPTMATHEHIRAVYACVDRAGRAEIQKGCAESVKRAVFLAEEKAIDWHSEDAQGLEKIRSFVESKTVWHPIGN